MIIYYVKVTEVKESAKAKRTNKQHR